MTRKALVAVSLLLGALLFGAAVSPRLVRAQEHPVGGLRISDEAGAPFGEVQAPPGEKHFRLDSGVQRLFIAFEYSGTQPTDVQLRVMGPMGAILFQEARTYDAPGTHVVEFDNGLPLEDNEYVINAYVGAEGYLADSLQLAVGEAQIPGPVVDSDFGAPTPEVAQATMLANLPAQPGGSAAAGAPAEVPGGPPRGMLVLAGFGALLLVAVVVWAGRSALRGN